MRLLIIIIFKQKRHIFCLAVETLKKQKERDINIYIILNKKGEKEKHNYCLFLTTFRVELEVDNITILNIISLTHLMLLTLITASSLILQLVKIFPMNNFSADEAPLHISMNTAGSLRGLPSLLDSPALDLISTSGEEILEVDLAEASLDDAVDAAVDLLLGAVLGGFFGAHGDEVRFEFSGDGDHGFASLLIDPVLELGEVLVALAAVVVFGEVDEEDGGLGGEEVEGLEEFDFFSVPLAAADLLTGFEVGLEGVEHIKVALLGLVETALEDGLELINVALN